MSTRSVGYFGATLRRFRRETHQPTRPRIASGQTEVALKATTGHILVYEVLLAEALPKPVLRPP